MFSKIEIQ